MKKLISNKAAKIIQEKHTFTEIKKGIVTLKKIENEKERETLLKMKLLEEVNEYLFAESEEEKEAELNDVLEVVRALKDESPKFSEGWILENTK